MRRIILLLCVGMFAPCVFANNEAVYTISYNPSRLGVYKQLKAVYGADLKGGVEVKNEGELNIQSAAGKTIELKDNQAHHQYNGGGEYRETADKRVLSYIAKVEPTESEGTTSLKGNAVIQMIYEGIVNFWPQKAANEYEYKIDAESQPSSFSYGTGSSKPGTNVTIYGGTFAATGDSFIDVFDKSTVANLSATVNGLLHIEKDFHALDEYTLGNITIIDNSASCQSEKCQRYSWSTRKDSTGKEYKVLAVQVKDK